MRHVLATSKNRKVKTWPSLSVDFSDSFPLNATSTLLLPRSIVASRKSCPQTFCIAFGRQAESAFVLTIELRGIFISDVKAGLRGVHSFIQHQPASFLQSQLLLELQRAHGRGCLEMRMEARYAHVQFVGDVFDSYRAIETLADHANGLDHAMRLPSQVGYVAQSMALLAIGQSKYDLAKR